METNAKFIESPLILNLELIPYSVSQIHIVAPHLIEELHFKMIFNFGMVDAYQVNYIQTKLIVMT